MGQKSSCLLYQVSPTSFALADSLSDWSNHSTGNTHFPGIVSVTDQKPHCILGAHREPDEVPGPGCSLQNGGLPCERGQVWLLVSNTANGDIVYVVYFTGKDICRFHELKVFIIQKELRATGWIAGSDERFLKRENVLTSKLAR